MKMQKMHMLHAKKAIESLKKELAAERQKIQAVESESEKVLREIKTLSNEKNEVKTAELTAALADRKAEMKNLRELLAAEEKRTKTAKGKVEAEATSKAKGDKPKVIFLARNLKMGECFMGTHNLN